MVMCDPGGPWSLSETENSAPLPKIRPVRDPFHLTLQVLVPVPVDNRVGADLELPERDKGSKWSTSGLCFWRVAVT